MLTGDRQHLRPRERQPLLPRMDQHRSIVARLTLENAPDRQCAVVVLLLLGKRAIQRRHNVAKRRSLLADFPLNTLPPINLEYPAASRCRNLLLLAGPTVRGSLPLH